MTEQVPVETMYLDSESRTQVHIHVERVYWSRQGIWDWGIPQCEWLFILWDKTECK